MSKARCCTTDVGELRLLVQIPWKQPSDMAMILSMALDSTDVQVMILSESEEI